jgi:hypothetical protein
MINTSKVLISNFKTIATKLCGNAFSQIKTPPVNTFIASNSNLPSEGSQLNSGSMTTHIGFNITHAKNITEIINDVPVQNYLKKVQKTAEIVHAFNPQTNH